MRQPVIPKLSKLSNAGGRSWRNLTDDQRALIAVAVMERRSALARSEQTKRARAKCASPRWQQFAVTRFRTAAPPDARSMRR
jgi:hypothetical protein